MKESEKDILLKERYREINIAVDRLMRIKRKRAIRKVKKWLLLDNILNS